VHVKFFTPDSRWTWYVTEGESEQEDVRLFSHVVWVESEWGYVMLSELEAARGPLGLRIERDLYFTPQPFSKVERLETLERSSPADQCRLFVVRRPTCHKLCPPEGVCQSVCGASCHIVLEQRRYIPQ